MKAKISTLLAGQRFSFLPAGTVYEVVLKDNIDMQVRGWDGEGYTTDPLEIDFTERGNPAHLPVLIQ